MLYRCAVIVCSNPHTDHDFDIGVDHNCDKFNNGRILFRYYYRFGY